jgi:hypothetical protein
VGEKCDCCPIEGDAECEGQHHPPLCTRVCGGEQKYINLVIGMARPSAPHHLLAPSDPPSHPSLARQAWNAARAIFRAGTSLITTGHLKATRDQQEARLAICRECDRYDETQVRCRECGCYLVEKTSWITEQCPLSPPKWGPLVPPSGSAGCGGCGGA